MPDVTKKLEKYDCHFAPTCNRLIPIYKAVTLAVKNMFYSH